MPYSSSVGSTASSDMPYMLQVVACFIPKLTFKLQIATGLTIYSMILTLNSLLHHKMITSLTIIQLHMNKINSIWVLVVVDLVVLINMI